MKRTCATSSWISFLTSAAIPPQLRRLAQTPLPHSFGAADSASFWKRGSFRSGSNIGSSRRNAGVSGTVGAGGASYDIESSFCNAAIARSGSPICAATRARISIGAGPSSASFSIGTTAIPFSTNTNAAGLSPHAIARRDLEQAVFAFRFAKFVRRLDDLIEFLNRCPLIVDRHFGISDDVDKEDVRDLELDLFFNLSGHFGAAAKYLGSTADSREQSPPPRDRCALQQQLAHLHSLRLFLPDHR